MDVPLVEARAVRRELPTVVHAADAALFIATEKQRRVAMGAAVVHHAHATGRVPERDQLLAEQFQADRVAVGPQLRRQRRRDPVLAHQLAHGGAGPDPGEVLVHGLCGLAGRFASSLIG